MYRVIIVAPPTLAIVPNTFANPSLLAILICSSLHKSKRMVRWSKEKKNRSLKNITLVYETGYLRAEAIRKVIAGTEFCIDEAKVGDV